MSNKRKKYDDETRGSAFQQHKRSNHGSESDSRILLIKLGDPCSKVENELDVLVAILEKEMAKKEDKDDFIEKFCKCCISFPSKVTTYATLLGLINLKNYNVCGEIIEILNRSYLVYLEAQKWTEALTIVHFFANLVNCCTLRNTSLMEMFEALLEATLEDNSTQARSDYFVYTVLSSLMYVGREVFESKPQDLDQIFNTIYNFISKRKKLYLNALRVWPSDDPQPQVDYLESLWTQISNMKELKWKENFIDRPYNIESIQERLKDNLEHNLQRMKVPAHNPSAFYPYPRVVFRIFDEDAIDDDEEEKFMPKADSIERFYLEHQFRCLIDEYSGTKKSCARDMLQISPRKELSVEFVLVEHLIGELLALPMPRKPDILYSSLMLDLINLKPQHFTAAIAKAIQIMYENLDTMNVTCVDRFVNWFSFHLNNYSFLWSWNQWLDCLSEDDLHPKPVFVRELISKCIRISFYDKTSALLKDTLAPLMPNEPAVRDKFISDKEAPGHSLAMDLRNMIIKKVELSSYNSLLTINLDEDKMDEIDEKPVEHLMKVDVFTNVVLNIAAISFTHLFSAIGKFQNVFRKLMKTDDSKMQLLKSIHYTWKTHPQLQVVLVDKLLKIDLIDVCVVCNWIFTPEMSLEAMKFYPWEILNKAILRQCKKKDSFIKDIMKAECNPELETDPNLEEQFDAAITTERKMFCIIFERFTKILSEHIHKCKSARKEFKNHWFRWMIGHMQQVFFLHNKHIFAHVEAIESSIFTSDVLDPHILLIFRQFLSLRA